jgi:hypothetical protein
VSDRTTRLVASLALGVAPLALVLAGVAISRASESEAQMRELSESLRRALESRPRSLEGTAMPPSTPRSEARPTARAPVAIHRRAGHPSRPV